MTVAAASGVATFADLSIDKAGTGFKLSAGGPGIVTPVASDQFNIVYAGLVGWWAAEGNADDIVYGNNGTVQGGVTFTAGKVGQAFSFNGVDDGVLIGANANLDIGSGDGLTIDAWIFPKGAGTGAAFGGSGPIVEYKNGVHFWQLESGDPLTGLFVNLIDTNSVNHTLEVPAGVTQNEWNHVAVTYSKTTGVVTLYRNGSAVGSQDLGVFTPRTTTDLYLGRRPPDSFSVSGGASFNGLLDEVDIFDRALTGDEILAIYNAGINGKPTP